MKTLLIAPRTDLPNVDTEVQAIWQSGLDIEPRIGEVRHADVLRAVTNGDYDAFWFAGHATKDGLMLTDGPLSASELTPMIRDRFELVVINSCDSQQTAQMLQNETGAAVVATVVEVPDWLAFQTGALFAQKLAETGDIPTAYNAARPGNNRQYVLLGWGKKKVVENVDIRLIIQRLDRMEAAQRETREAQQVTIELLAK